MITDSVFLSTAENLDTLKTLSDLATSTFHTATYSKDQETTEIDVCSENGRLILFFNALFHLCQITLHSLIVPLFSGTSVDESICRETVRKSAERVVNHAQSFENYWLLICTRRLMPRTCLLLWDMVPLSQPWYFWPLKCPVGARHRLKPLRGGTGGGESCLLWKRFSAY